MISPYTCILSLALTHLSIRYNLGMKGNPPNDTRPSICVGIEAVWRLQVEYIGGARHLTSKKIDFCVEKMEIGAHLTDVC